VNEQKQTHILILGGAGRVGQALLRLALNRGYRVTAIVRDPGKLALTNNSCLKLVKGDVTDLALVQSLMSSDVDAVLSTLGIFQREPGTPLADLTAPLLELMKKVGIKRLVCMSSLGVGDTRNLGNLLVKFITRVTLRYVLIDKACQEKLIEHSGLDWTILRPPRILDNEKTAPYLRWREPPIVGKPRWQISKKDAAAEMLSLLEDPSSVEQTWQISY
jgi:putative NADH-flavin reductase